MDTLKHTQPYCVVVQMSPVLSMWYNARLVTYFETFYVERFASLSKPKLSEMMALTQWCVLQSADPH